MDETSSLQIIEHFERLNLKYNKELKNMVLLAAKLCNTPVSFIALLDKDNESLKIKHGLSTDHIPSKLSFCLHDIKFNDILVVSDTHNDIRYCSHPGVIDNLKVRFYVAAPLLTRNNHRIGTLCVMDYKPHEMTDQEKLIFKIIARHIISVMELKLSLDQLNHSIKELKKERETRLNNEIKLRSMFESLNDAYFLLGKQGELIDFNRAAYNFVNEVYNVQLSYGFILKNIFPKSQHYGFTHHLNNALRGKKKHMERLTNYAIKGQVWWDCTFDCVRNCKGEIIGASYITRNISERKMNEAKILEQNRLLTRIAEIQSHDYRGPVASIMGLMSLIEDDGYVASKEYLLLLQKAVNKLDEKIQEVVNIVTTI